MRQRGNEVKYLNRRTKTFWNGLGSRNMNRGRGRKRLMAAWKAGQRGRVRASCFRVGYSRSRDIAENIRGYSSSRRQQQRPRYPCPRPLAPHFRKKSDNNNDAKNNKPLLSSSSSLPSASLSLSILAKAKGRKRGRGREREGERGRERERDRHHFCRKSRNFFLPCCALHFSSRQRERGEGRRRRQKRDEVKSWPASFDCLCRGLCETLVEASKGCRWPRENRNRTSG